MIRNEVRYQLEFAQAPKVECALLQVAWAKYCLPAWEERFGEPLALRHSINEALRWAHGCRSGPVMVSASDCAHVASEVVELRSSAKELVYSDLDRFYPPHLMTLAMHGVPWARLRYGEPVKPGPQADKCVRVYWSHYGPTGTLDEIAADLAPAIDLLDRGSKHAKQWFDEAQEQGAGRLLVALDTALEAQ